MVARCEERLILEIDSVPIHERFIEIRDAASGGRVITVIEFLSPSNKLPGDGKVQFKRKQTEWAEAKVNLVEIDLTRTGQREMLIAESALTPEHRTPFQACVFRASWKQFGRKEAYRLPLRERMPAIPIPLRAADRDILLDLQPLVDEAYQPARYDRTIDYKQPADPPLDAEDAAWANELLKNAGKR